MRKRVERHARPPGWRLSAFIFVLLLVGLGGSARAGTTGKLAGRIVDKDGHPVSFAAVVLAGTTLGNNTDDDGRYHVINVPPGTYDVSVSHVAFRSVMTKGVLVTVDNTTWLNLTLETAVQTLGEVVVQAERPLIDVRVTSARATVTADEIADLPVQELQEVVNLQAGVVDGHFRGGRLGEVQYQVDGVSVNDPYSNKSSLTIDRSLLQEVQVISGVFDAEYGQAMSGVVNAVLKEGGDSLEWNFEVYGGGFYFPDNDKRPVPEDDEIRMDATGSLQGSLSGPLPLPKTTYLLSARRYLWDDYLTATQYLKLLQPTIGDSADNPDGRQQALGYSRETSGVLKITNRSIPGVKVSYQAIGNYKRGRRTSFAWVLNPDGLTKQKTVSVTHGLDWTQTVNPNTFYNLSLRENYYDYQDMLYEDFWDPSYDAAGPPIYSEYVLNRSLVIAGADLTRFIQKTNTFMAKGAFTSQVTPEHLVKLGVEGQWPKVTFGSPGFLIDDGGVILRRRNQPPDYPVPKEYHPTIAAGYAQSQLEWNDFTVRTGLRLEHFHAHATIPSDLANPANSIDGVPASHPVPVEAKTAISPRVAMAYPITERAGIHFAYGHFTQYPPLSDIFTKADYATLHGLQAGQDDIPVMGNPDIKAERTVQYELGYKQMLSGAVGGSINIFYKDIRDLLGVEFIQTYNLAEYARLTNVDFGDVIGFTLSLDQRQLGLLSSTLDYTWQQAQGNSSDPRETATRAEGKEDPRPRLIPLNWDQRHTLNLTLRLENPARFSTSAIVRVAGGQPYTPILDSGFNAALNANSGRKPSSVVIDLRGERFLRLGRQKVSVFGRVFNLLDTRTVNGTVFNSTGSADYSRFPVTDQATLANPTRYYAPRRVEFGLTMDSGW